MFKFLKDSKNQKDMWFVFSTMIFFVFSLNFRNEDFLPSGVIFCVGYIVLISVGFIFINLKAEKSL